MLEVDARLRIGSLDLDVRFQVDAGEVVALVGPNGAGKSTTLRAVAGLQPIDDGRIVLDGVPLDEPSAGVLVPPNARPLGVVFQDHALFGRMTALENVAFGLRARGVAKDDARHQASAWLERLGLAAQATQRPATLSGGQAQRVALARALAIEPRLLLLDEPLAALDASVRPAVRAELRHHLASFPGGRLLVTHDPIDALVLADRLVVLEQGRVVQSGDAVEVVRRPATRYVADLVGLNLLHGDAVDPHTVRLGSGAELTVADPLPGPLVAVAIRPQAVALHRGRPEGSPRNAWPATVGAVEHLPAMADANGVDRVRVTLEGAVPLTAEVTPAAVSALDLRPGAAVWAAVKAVDLTTYER